MKKPIENTESEVLISYALASTLVSGVSKDFAGVVSSSVDCMNFYVFNLIWFR